MGKNIVICSDGTGNRGGKGKGTNVWRLFKGLDLTSRQPRQIAFYDDGVGTEDNKYFKAVTGAFGFGFSRNVKEAYKFLSINYEQGDRIFMFGFSRGAYTVRALAAFVVTMGLVPRASSKSEAVVDETINALVKAYFELRKKGEKPSSDIKIHFLGVWDTVGAIALPRDFPFRERLLNQFFKFKFKDEDLHENINRACQALALDDQRRTFHPEIWNPRPGITQVWFAGMHSDVGGGYPKQGMAHVSLQWMIKQVGYDSNNQEGLVFSTSFQEEVRARANVNDKMYDSRSGGSAFYRYAPRTLPKNHVRIHRSVFERIKQRTQAYYPGNLPAQIEIVDDCADSGVTCKSVPVIKQETKKMIDFRKVLHLAFILLFLLVGAALVPSCKENAPNTLAGWLAALGILSILSLGELTKYKGIRVLHSVLCLSALAVLAYAYATPLRERVTALLPDISWFTWDPAQLPFAMVALILFFLLALGLVRVDWLGPWQKVFAFLLIALITDATLRVPDYFNSFLNFAFSEKRAINIVAFCNNYPWMALVACFAFGCGLLLRGILKRRCRKDFEALWSKFLEKGDRALGLAKAKDGGSSALKEKDDAGST